MRTSVAGWPLTAVEQCGGQLFRRPGGAVKREPATPCFQCDHPGGRPQRRRCAGRARRVDRIRQQSGPFPDGHEAVGVLEDLDRSGEDILLFGPEEAVEDLPGPRELDLEFDPAGQVGRNSPRDGVHASVAIGPEPAGDRPVRRDDELEGTGRLAVGDERVAAVEIVRHDGRPTGRSAGCGARDGHGLVDRVQCILAQRRSPGPSAPWDE